MNSIELRKSLQELSTMPLEKMSSSEIGKLGKLAKEYLSNLYIVNILSQIEEQKNTISIENLSFYKYFLSKSKIKVPSKNGTKQQWENYLIETQKYYKMIESKKNYYVKILNKIDKSSYNKAMELLGSLNKEDRKLISFLANLSRKTSKGVQPINLSNSSNSDKTWYNELKNVKSLGVLANG